MKSRSVVDENRASSAAPLSYDTLQAAGACASSAAPLSLGSGARASCAARPNHAPRSTRTAAPARRSIHQASRQCAGNLFKVPKEYPNPEISVGSIRRVIVVGVATLPFLPSRKS